LPGHGTGLDVAVVEARQIMRIRRRDPVAVVDWRRYSQQPIQSVAMRAAPWQFCSVRVLPTEEALPLGKIEQA